MSLSCKNKIATSSVHTDVYTHSIHLPDSLVCLCEHRPIRPRHGHGIVAHVDLAAAQQRLAADLQALVQDGQQEDADASRRHL